MNSKSLNRILQFREERDWKQFHLPKNLAISLPLESAEVLELFQWTKDNNHEFDVDLDRDLAAKMNEHAAKYHKL